MRGRSECLVDIVGRVVGLKVLQRWQNFAHADLVSQNFCCPLFRVVLAERERVLPRCTCRLPAAKASVHDGWCAYTGACPIGDSREPANERQLLGEEGDSASQAKATQC